MLVAGRATWSKQLICGLADVAMILLCLSVVLVLARVSARAAIVLFLDGRTVSLFVDLELGGPTPVRVASRGVSECASFRVGRVVQRSRSRVMCME